MISPRRSHDRSKERVWNSGDSRPWYCGPPANDEDGGYSPLAS